MIYVHDHFDSHRRYSCNDGDDDVIPDCLKKKEEKKLPQKIEKQTKLSR